MTLSLPTPARAGKIAIVAAAHGLSLAFWIRAFEGPWSWAAVAMGLLAGHLLIDFVTIMVHWTVDNYFEPTTPGIGSTVYYFREHHDKAYEMFTRDYVEGNFRNSLLTAVVMTGLLFVVSGCWANVMVAHAGLLGAYITQIHKWAHMKKPPGAILALQRARLLVGWHHHNVHHGNASWNYGLCAGWFDKPMDRMRVFEAMEWLVYRLTGHRAVEARLNFDTSAKADT